MATAGQKELSLQEFLSLPEEKPALEYVEGKVARKPMPKARHSRLQKLLCRELDRALGRDFEAFPELRCTFDDRSLVLDVVVLSRSQIPRDESGELGNDVFVAPHAAIEILSPEQGIAELVEKAAFCVNHGVQWACVIDPERKRVVVFHHDDLPRQLGGDETLEDSELLPGFRLTVAELFGWLRLPGA
jgi:Uma2 family endonuclease